MIKILGPIAKNVIKNGTSPKHFTKGLKLFLKEVADPSHIHWKSALKSGNTLRYLTTLGGTKLRAFIRSSKNWRVNRWVVLMSLVYLAEEQRNGTLAIPKNRWKNLVADTFSGFAWRQHGAMFQLSQIAYYHLHNKFAGGPKIITIEGLRKAHELVNGDHSDISYGRLIDIVLSDGIVGEVWVETKSFKLDWFTQSLRKKNRQVAFS